MMKISEDCKEVPLRHGLVGVYIHLLASVVGVQWGVGVASSPQGQALIWVHAHACHLLAK